MTEPTSRQRANHALLRSIEALWDLCPEQRFGQLIMNIARDETGFPDTWEWKHGRWYDAIDELYQAIEPTA